MPVNADSLTRGSSKCRGGGLRWCPLVPATLVNDVLWMACCGSLCVCVLCCQVLHLLLTACSASLWLWYCEICCTVSSLSFERHFSEWAHVYPGWVRQWVCLEFQCCQLGNPVKGILTVVSPSLPMHVKAICCTVSEHQQAFVFAICLVPSKLSFTCAM